MISRIAVGAGGMTVHLDPAKLLAACAARGWSLTELARRARVSRPTLHQALAGRAVRPRTAYRLAQVLDEVKQPSLLEMMAISDR